MSLTKYLRDKLPICVCFISILAILLIFMKAYRVDDQAQSVIILLFVLVFLLTLMWDYFKKKAFFRGIKVSLDSLDKKYLLCETIDEPDFYEGQILKEILGECGKSMAESVADCRRENRELEEYIETWVHEIKLPISTVRLMLYNSAEVDKRILNQVKLIDDYVNNVLYYSRAKNSQHDYLVQEVALKKVVGDVVRSNRELLQLIDASLEITDLDVNVLTDNKWMEFILGQLLTNSIKYRDNQRQLVIKIYAEKCLDRCVLHFVDNGVGVDKADISRVFEKSFTGKNGHENSTSTGMGLYIAKNLCNKLGHGIDIESVRGEYTEVMITFYRNNFYKM